MTARAMLDYVAFSRFSWSRPAGIALPAALIPLMLRLPPVGVAAVTASVLAAVAIANVGLLACASEADDPTRAVGRSQQLTRRTTGTTSGGSLPTLLPASSPSGARPD